jgi:hypothetical protein
LLNDWLEDGRKILDAHECLAFGQRNSLVVGFWLNALSA